MYCQPLRREAGTGGVIASGPATATINDHSLKVDTVQAQPETTKPAVPVDGDGGFFIPKTSPCRSCRRLRSFALVILKAEQKIAAFGSSYRGVLFC
jgi:hypothetical protein